MQNHFADLELEVRKYLSDLEIRAKVLEDLAQNILREMVKMHGYREGAMYFQAAPKSSVSFNGAVIKGVASVIADELGKNEEPKKPTTE